MVLLMQDDEAKESGEREDSSQCTAEFLSKQEDEDCSRYQPPSGTVEPSLPLGATAAIPPSTYQQALSSAAHSAVAGLADFLPLFSSGVEDGSGHGGAGVLAAPLSQAGARPLDEESSSSLFCCSSKPEAKENHKEEHTTATSCTIAAVSRREEENAQHYFDHLLQRHLDEEQSKNTDHNKPADDDDGGVLELPRRRRRDDFYLWWEDEKPVMEIENEESDYYYKHYDRMCLSAFGSEDEMTEDMGGVLVATGGDETNHNMSTQHDPINRGCSGGEATFLSSLFEEREQRTNGGEDDNDQNCHGASPPNTFYGQQTANNMSSRKTTARSVWNSSTVLGTVTPSPTPPHDTPHTKSPTTASCIPTSRPAASSTAQGLILPGEFTLQKRPPAQRKLFASSEPPGAPFRCVVPTAAPSTYSVVLGNYQEQDVSNNSIIDTSTRRFSRFQSQNWTEKFREAKAFLGKHGHCRIPMNYPENPALARWAKRQRAEFKKALVSSSLKPQQQIDQKSPNEDDEEEIHDRRCWQSRDSEASAAPFVPWSPSPSRSAPPRQQHQPAHVLLTRERIQILNDIGFVWDLQHTVWMERYEELKAFQACHGHADVPAEYPRNKRLATWVRTQRTNFARRAISAGRVQLLNGIGFTWWTKAHKNKTEINISDRHEAEEKQKQEKTAQQVASRGVLQHDERSPF